VAFADGQAGSNTQRGQQWKGILQIEQGVRPAALQFVPVGTRMQITVTPAGGGSGDGTIITFT
jgi:hypothetical protein